MPLLWWLQDQKSPIALVHRGMARIAPASKSMIVLWTSSLFQSPVLWWISSMTYWGGLCNKLVIGLILESCGIQLSLQMWVVAPYQLCGSSLELALLSLQLLLRHTWAGDLPNWTCMKSVLGNTLLWVSSHSLILDPEVYAKLVELAQRDWIVKYL